MLGGSEVNLERIQLFGWDFNGLELKVNQRICECLTRTGKLKEAVSFFRNTKIDDVDGGSQWARGRSYVHPCPRQSAITCDDQHSRWNA